MNNPAKIVLRKSVCAAGLLALAGQVSGCKTTFRTVDARFMAQPANYQRVQILPVWFESAGNVDHTLSTNDLQALCAQAVENLSASVGQTLKSKGCQIVEPVSFLPGDKASSTISEETWRQLDAVRIDFCDNLPRSYSATVSGQPLSFRTNTTLGFNRYMSNPNWKRAKMEPNPFRYQMTPVLTNLMARFGADNSEAVLLVNTKAFFESKHNHTKRTVWNWTGGGVMTITEVGVNLAVVAAAALTGAGSAPVPIWADPFWHSSNSLQHNIVLVDAHSQEVLWLNQQNFKHKDPRNKVVLAETVADTLADFPDIY